MKNLIDLTSKTYGKWTVLNETDKVNGQRMWSCKCTCGKVCTINHGNLTQRRSKSCLNCRKTHFNHGLADKHILYSTWKSMNSRCNNPNVKHYYRYGGRGIKVCEKWKNFKVFIDDMFPTYQAGKTLDRVDNDKGYSKENCKWSTISEQNNNQAKCLKLEYNGNIYTEAELARYTGVSRTTIQTRRRKGASVEEMIHGFKRI